MILIVTALLLTTGCWDMVEINRRVYPYSVGLDLNEEDKGDKYEISMTYPNINAIGKNTTQEQRIYFLSTTGNSIFAGSKKLTDRLEFPYYDKHLRAALIGKELAKEEETIKELVDALMRDFIINKKIRLTVVDGKASDLLSKADDYKRQLVVEGTIYNMLTNNQNSTAFTTQSLANFISETDYSNASLMPIIRANKDELVVSGGAVFKDFKLVGYINAEENRSIAMLKGEVKNDIIDVIYKGVGISYNITYLKTKKKLIKTEDNIKVQFNIETRGNIQEYIFMDEPDLENEEILNDVERAIQEKMKEELNNTIQKIQKDYNADLIEVTRYLKAFHPKVWEEVEEDWDSIFPDIEIEPNFDIKIIRKGLIK